MFALCRGERGAPRRAHAGVSSPGQNLELKPLEVSSDRSLQVKELRPPSEPAQGLGLLALPLLLPPAFGPLTDPGASSQTADLGGGWEWWRIGQGFDIGVGCVPDEAALWL